MRTFIAGSAVILLLAAALSGGPKAHAAVAPRVGWWAGQNVGLCGADPLSCPRDNGVYTPQVWDALVAGRGFLNFDLVYHSDFGPDSPGVNRRADALPAVREANRRGVPINAWLTVPLGKGTFANEDNATEIRDAVKSFAAWSAEQKLRFGQVILDLEFPAGYQPLHDAIVDHDPTQLEQLMKGTIDPAHQCAAAAVYRDTIAWANQHGLRISGSPVLFALDDLGDGSVALQDALDMAPIPPAGYDSVYTQAYRAFGLDLGSGMVASYYRDAQRYFGARGQVSLGNVGLPPYTTITPLADDIRMLAGMGATEIPIFDFDSTVKAFGAAGIGDVLDAAHHPMSGTELTAAQRMTPAGTAARGLFHTLDEFATTSTPILGGLQRPNPVPGGCTS